MWVKCKPLKASHLSHLPDTLARWACGLSHSEDVLTTASTPPPHHTPTVAGWNHPHDARKEGFLLLYPISFLTVLFLSFSPLFLLYPRIICLYEFVHFSKSFPLQGWQNSFRGQCNRCHVIKFMLGCSIHWLSKLPRVFWTLLSNMVWYFVSLREK